MKKKWPFWLGLGLLVLVFLYLVKAILLPFVLGIMVAYFFDPLADKLESAGLSRSLSTLLITAVFFISFFSCIGILLPLLYHQLDSLIAALPDLITEHQQRIMPMVHRWLHTIDPGTAQKISDSIKNASTTILGFIAGLLSNVMQSGLALINLLSLIFVTPVVAFYFLRDWDRMVARLYTLLPRRHSTVIKQQLILVDDAISGFIRGQTQVCLSLGAFYAIALTFAGVEGGALIGFFTGFATFIPYVGMLSGTFVGLIVAWIQFGTWEGVLTVAAIFLAGQMIESNFVAPKLVGDKVGLHPVWIIFGMLSGATLFGFLGILIAVPVTAVLGVLTRFLIAQYKASQYYKK